MNKDLVMSEQALENQNSNIKSKRCPISFSTEKVEGKDTTKIINPIDNSEANICQAFLEVTGCQNWELACDIITRGGSASTQKSINAQTNIITQALSESSPQDVFEARLAVQAHALHEQGMRYLGGLNDGAGLQTAQFFLNCATKLLRLQNETVEALCKYRRKGESKMIVQHVTVNDNGKAIVSGAVVQGENQNSSR